MADTAGAEYATTGAVNDQQGWPVTVYTVTVK
jgi:hypothetical protein